MPADRGICRSSRSLITGLRAFGEKPFDLLLLLFLLLLCVSSYLLLSSFNRGTKPPHKKDANLHPSISVLHKGVSDKNRSIDGGPQNPVRVAKTTVTSDQAKNDSDSNQRKFLRLNLLHKTHLYVGGDSFLHLVILFRRSRQDFFLGTGKVCFRVTFL